MDNTHRPHCRCERCGDTEITSERIALGPSDAAACSHRNRRDVGSSGEGLGSIIVYWCPDCGALKRTMTNWKCTDYPWEIPSRANVRPLAPADNQTPDANGDS